MFLETVLSFLGVSVTLYAVAQLYMYISHDAIIKPTVHCRYCKKFISDQVCSRFILFRGLGGADG